MRRDDIKNPAEAAIYITDCLLATVDDFCMKKNPPVGEFKRHISVAQTSIDLLLEHHSYNLLDSTYGRIHEVLTTFGNSVDDYAKSVRGRWFPEDNQRFYK